MLVSNVCPPDRPLYKAGPPPPSLCHRTPPQPARGAAPHSSLERAGDFPKKNCVSVRQRPVFRVLSGIPIFTGYDSPVLKCRAFQSLGTQWEWHTDPLLLRLLSSSSHCPSLGIHFFICEIISLMAKISLKKKKVKKKKIVACCLKARNSQCKLGSVMDWNLLSSYGKIVID